MTQTPQMQIADQVFILRFWREPGSGEDCWRVKIGSVNQGSWLHVDGVAAAFAAIRASLAEAKPKIKRRKKR